MNYRVISRISLAGLIISFALAASPAFAATDLLLSPVPASVKMHEIVPVTITVQPNQIKNYTVRAELSFPADLLSLQSFTFASPWIPLNQAGYDSVDNGAGRVVKSAGYPGGFSSPVVLGTAFFTAKRAGSGTIEVQKSSFVLDAAGANVISAAPRTIGVRIVSPIPVVAPRPSVSAPVKQEPVVQEPVVPIEEVPALAPEIALRDVSAAAAERAFDTKSNSVLLLWLVAGFAILSAAGYIAYRRIKTLESIKQRLKKIVSADWFKKH